MKITLYTICYNEQEMLPYFLNHYSKMVDKIVVYDNQSTDNSRQILESFKDPKFNKKEKLGCIFN